MAARILDCDMARTYEIRTYGCQMNVHDSERLAGLLEDAGYERARAVDAADLVVFNTCAVRENADNRLYGNLGHLYPAKAANPDMQIAVGGCLAQKDRGRIVEKAPWVDVVFGTHNLAALPVLLERARHNKRAEVEIVEALQNFPSDLPTRRESRVQRLGVDLGRLRQHLHVLHRPVACAATRPTAGPATCWPRSARSSSSGVVEVTLLGQNVNSYGRSFGDRFAFGKLLRACGEIDGLERVRFTSPHPRDFTDDVIAAMAETPNVMPQLHMPMQSGSDAVLKRDAPLVPARALPRRSSTDVRAAMPDAAITTDIIVGFPGETEADFEQTLDVVRAARFASAFTFQYSQRPGTPAADDGRPGAEGGRPGTLRAADRAAGADLVGRRAKALVGREVEVLVSAGEGRKDGATGRVSGRARDGRLVHVAGRRPSPATSITADGHLRRAAPPGRRRRHHARTGPGAARRAARARRADAAADDRPRARLCQCRGSVGEQRAARATSSSAFSIRAASPALRARSSFCLGLGQPGAQLGQERVRLDAAPRATRRRRRRAPAARRRASGRRGGASRRAARARSSSNCGLQLAQRRLRRLGVARCRARRPRSMIASFLRWFSTCSASRSAKVSERRAKNASCAARNRVHSASSTSRAGARRRPSTRVIRSRIAAAVSRQSDGAGQLLGPRDRASPWPPSPCRARRRAGRSADRAGGRTRRGRRRTASTARRRSCGRRP